MRAYAADKFGDLDQLTLRDLPRPVPGPGQVLVEVKAAALNPADLKVLAHKDGGSFLHASVFPLIPGFDFSGTIAESGGDVEGRAVGDDVYGFLPYARSNRTGTCAEFVVVDAHAIGRKPAAITHEQAAAAATSTVTALQVLDTTGRLQQGGRVLLHGASGGVGSYAIQIAKLLGASHVTATASAAKLDYVRGLGADHAIDYKTTPLRTLAAGSFDVVADLAATSSYGECAALLAPRGTYVSTLPSPRLFLGMARALFSSRRCKFFVVKPRSADLDRIAGWFADGKLQSAVDKSYPLAELPAALAHLRTGSVRGKLAITIPG